MSTLPLCFELPGNLTAKKLIDQLAKKNNLQFVVQHYSLKTFYDTFDWRLYRADLFCELQRSKIQTQLRLYNQRTSEILTTAALENVPTFAADMLGIPALEPVIKLLDMRALLPITTLDLPISRWAVLNKRQKPTLYLTIEEYSDMNQRLYLEPMAGYRKVVKEMVQFLTETLALAAPRQSVLVAALKTQGRKPADYSSKFEVALQPEMQAEQAVRLIYSQLLTTIKRNEQGTISATDSEFLHDFRVAVRRMRTGLGQFKTVLPAEVSAEQRDNFAWLGEITSPMRDLDVYLLNFPAYQASLPVPMQQDLLPLQRLLQQKQALAQKELAQHLTSARYVAMMIAWESFLKQRKPWVGQKPQPAIKVLADRRIWKTYQQVLEQGSAIDDNSAPERLHDLRKTCKKLRYLLEFFQSLYPPAQMKALISVLKGFQEVLGDFQDYAVQEITLKNFSADMHTETVSEATFLAIGQLIDNLGTKRCQARADFAGRFATFNAVENQQIFKMLFINNLATTTS